MAKRDRQLERLRRSRADVRPETIRTLLLGYGFELRSVSGSHWVYNHAVLKELVVIPHRRPVLPVYVRAVIQAIDEVLEHENS